MRKNKDVYPISSKQRSLPHQYASTELPLSVRLSAPNPSQMQTRIKCNAKRYKPIPYILKESLSRQRHQNTIRKTIDR